MPRWHEPDLCDTCGKFVRVSGEGVSWSQTWGYSMDGTPDLHDIRYRCSPCTDKIGPRETNCAHPERFSGRNAISRR